MWRKIQPVRKGTAKVLVPGTEGGEHGEEEGDGQQEDADGDAAVAGVDGEEGEREDEGEEGLDLVGLDGQAMVGGVEGLGEGDEVEEDGGDGGGDGEAAPRRADAGGIGGERGGQHREGGDAVEDDRDTEPEEGHRRVRATLQYIRRAGMDAGARGLELRAGHLVSGSAREGSMGSDVGHRESA